MQIAVEDTADFRLIAIGHHAKKPRVEAYLTSMGETGLYAMGE